tara:strand:+ start:1569 stop:2183 length:615 start_codon:yes stop_codon:yes gene_type:complete
VSGLVSRITMQDVKEKLGKLSITNQYQVNFSILKKTITDYLELIGIDNTKEFLSRDAGILCSDASLPASAFATGEVKDNFMGIPQEFAHTRLYTDIDFTFYVDQDYTLLRIFEGWMDYIASGADNDGIGLGQRGFYRRFKYPNDYKCDTMSITKFEKNLGRTLLYEFVNAFPKSITPIPVTYGTADLLKVTVSFNYDRYVVTRS